MESELLHNWVTKLFVPHTKHIPSPILLILDDHASHLDIEMIDKLIENDIHLFGLPPHTTDILPPLDVAIFRLFKVYFSKVTDMVTLHWLV